MLALKVLTCTASKASYRILRIGHYLHDQDIAIHINNVVR